MKHIIFCLTLQKYGKVKIGDSIPDSWHRGMDFPLVMIK